MLRGIVWASNLASHFLAASISSSSTSVPLARVANVRDQIVVLQEQCRTRADIVNHDEPLIMARSGIDC